MTFTVDEQKQIDIAAEIEIQRKNAMQPQEDERNRANCLNIAQSIAQTNVNAGLDANAITSTAIATMATELMTFIKNG
tara:strand:+ start:440 stop:673 length:234 start_codon:yes stop_codon:yes gene_type:complete